MFLVGDLQLLQFHRWAAPHDREADVDLHYDQYVIPKGSWVMFPHPSIHWTEHIYGPKPLDYNPDRKVLVAGPEDNQAAVFESLGDSGLHGNTNFAGWGLGRHPVRVELGSNVVMQMFERG